MNIHDALRELLKILDDQTFIVHTRCLDEMKKLLQKDLKGKEEKFFELLIAQLKNIHDFGIMVYTVDHNERLKGGNGKFYSIHISQSQFNIRLIIHVGNSGKAYLLSTFYERAGKKESDYTRILSVVESRLNELMEDS